MLYTIKYAQKGAVDHKASGFDADNQIDEAGRIF
jgi:hypothetical protein